MQEAQHSMYIGPPCFAVFNDCELSNEPVELGDLAPFERSNSDDMEFAASAAWSAGAECYFVILPEGIVLLDALHRRGLLCRKKTHKFIELCIQYNLIRNTVDNKRQRKGPRP